MPNGRVRRLAPVIQDAGILEDGKEVVFYGVDSGEVTIRDNVGILGPGKTGTVTEDGEGGLDLKITEQFARSMSILMRSTPTISSAMR